MKEASTILTIMMTTVCAILGYMWCFTDTMIGGYVPMIIITIAPILTNIVGRIASTQEPSQY